MGKIEGFARDFHDRVFLNEVGDISHMRPEQTTEFTRRDWLRTTAGAGLIAGLAPALSLAKVAEEKPYGSFKMGLQSYSLRNFKLAEALQKTKELGLGFWESFPAHIPVDLTQVASNLKLAADHGVTAGGFGVVHFTKDHDANRKMFDFGKALGISYFSADPDEDAFESLDKCVEEYKIGVGIHNHGPGHKYGLIKTIHEAIKNHHPLIGCCIDTGHFLRSKEDPVEAARVFKGRIHGVHLKDVKNATEFTILGQGDLKVADILKELAAQKYSEVLALEYEEHPENPIADIQACLATVRKALS